MRRFFARSIVLPCSLVVSLTGCGGPDGPRTITVFATSSLTEAFGELAKAYRQGRPDVRVRLTFAGSQELVGRLDDLDAPDVLVTADAETMKTADDRVERPRIIARTALTIAVAPGNPKRIRDLADLTRPGLRVVLGAPTVPVGRYARRTLAASAVTVRPVSEEISARSVLTRVRTGEADAGIVYITDLRSAGAAAGHVPIPAVQNTTASYHAAVVRDGDQEEAATAFTAWLVSPAAQTVLRKYGFNAP